VSSIRHELNLLRRGEGITSVESVSGGVVGDVWLVSYHDGSRIVAKTSFGVPKDFFAVEAEGLNALSATGYVRTVEVLAVTERVLVMEALSPRDDRQPAWDAFAHDLAALHDGTVHDRFGWHGDTYLGWLPQTNAWCDDGHVFFVEHRLLRYLSEPLAEQALDPADRLAVERLCERLPEIIPNMPAVLAHNDLSSTNILGRPGGGLVLIDPAVCYTWAEADLSQLWCERESLPDAAGSFFALYQELNPSPPGWEERMPVLFLREILSTIAHLGTQRGRVVSYLRQVLGPFYRS
jgi:fructosamine-3-kinase